MPGIDTDPDWPDPDPQHWSRSKPVLQIRTQINSGSRPGFLISKNYKVSVGKNRILAWTSMKWVFPMCKKNLQPARENTHSSEHEISFLFWGHFYLREIRFRIRSTILDNIVHFQIVFLHTSLPYRYRYYLFLRMDESPLIHPLQGQRPKREVTFLEKFYRILHTW
jgi:hypothetical protein